MSKLHAVLTGDLIYSTRSAPAQVDEAMLLIETSVRLLDAEARFQRFRGDGWQVHLTPASQGLLILVFLAAQLRGTGKLCSRIALGVGDAYGYDQGSLGTAGGAAFVQSGRALDAMPDGRWFALAGQGVDPLHQALMAFLDAQIQRWSPQQAQAVALSLGPDNILSQQALADHLGISRQAYAARLAAAEFSLTTQALRAFSMHFAQDVAFG